MNSREYTEYKQAAQSVCILAAELERHGIAWTTLLKGTLARSNMEKVVRYVMNHAYPVNTWGDEPEFIEMGEQENATDSD